MCRFVQRPLRQDGIVFQYKFAPGACPKSYGLHVAALAGIPDAVCNVAASVGNAFELRLGRHFHAQPPVATAIGPAQTAAHAALSCAAAGAQQPAEDSDEDEWDALERLELAGLVDQVLGKRGGGLRNEWVHMQRVLPVLGIR